MAQPLVLLALLRSEAVLLQPNRLCHCRHLRVLRSALLTYCLLLTTYYLLLTNYCLLLTTYYLPLTTYHLLLTTHYLLLMDSPPLFRSATSESVRWKPA